MCPEHLALLFVSQKLVVRDWSVSKSPPCLQGGAAPFHTQLSLGVETRNGGASVVQSRRGLSLEPMYGA